MATATAALLTSTGAPAGAVDLRCPGPTARGAGPCGRFLGRVVPPSVGTTRIDLACPRCHQRTTFTIESSLL